MISSSFKSRDAASPWMVLISVCLHAAGILAIVVVSFTISSPTKPSEPMVMPITVRPELIGPPVMDTVAPDLAESSSEPPVQDLTEAPPPKETAEVPRETVDQAKLASVKSEPVQLAKRKRPPQRMAADKPLEKPKEPEKKKEVAQKKEDPKTVIEQRLAALRKEIEEKKKKSSSASPEGQAKPGGASGQQGGGGSDEESARWFNAVKNQINSHWSLMADSQQMEKFCKIGVQIAEDGKLRDATVRASSGDRVFDDSALRAVRQAEPFPPLPPQVKAIIKGGLLLNFDPRGIQ